MTSTELDHWHRDPANWRFIFFYFCPADPRIVVKKRFDRFGWTLNFARPSAVLLIITVPGAVYGSIRLSDHLAWGNTGFCLCLLIIIVGIVTLFAWLSNPKSYKAYSENPDS